MGGGGGVVRCSAGSLTLPHPIPSQVPPQSCSHHSITSKCKVCVIEGAGIGLRGRGGDWVAGEGLGLGWGHYSGHGGWVVTFHHIPNFYIQCVKCKKFKK